jgi:hypothetical protein
VNESAETFASTLTSDTDRDGFALHWGAPHHDPWCPDERVTDPFWYPLAAHKVTWTPQAQQIMNNHFHPVKIEFTSSGPVNVSNS